MLLAPEGEGATLCIGQASHAWVSGQLARAWEGLGERREEVCLAALQHDVAWLGWDALPERDPATGLPYAFTTIPPATWTALWGGAPDALATQSAYAGLLVSLHGSRLRAGQDSAQGYLAEQEEVQGRLLAQTGANHDEALRHRDLLALWDGLSLALCLGWDPFEQAGFRLAAATGVHTLDPWPFAVDALEVACEGRLLRGSFDDDASLHEALAAAPLRELRFALRPA